MKDFKLRLVLALVEGLGIGIIIGLVYWLFQDQAEKSNTDKAYRRVNTDGGFNGPGKVVYPQGSGPLEVVGEPFPDFSQMSEAEAFDAINNYTPPSIFDPSDIGIPNYQPHQGAAMLDEPFPSFLPDGEGERRT